MVGMVVSVAAIPKLTNEIFFEFFKSKGSKRFRSDVFMSLDIRSVKIYYAIVIDGPPALLVVLLSPEC
jgi:hypothetical protein